MLPVRFAANPATFGAPCSSVTTMSCGLLTYNPSYSRPATIILWCSGIILMHYPLVFQTHRTSKFGSLSPSWRCPLLFLSDPLASSWSLPCNTILVFSASSMKWHHPDISFTSRLPVDGHRIYHFVHSGKGLTSEAYNSFHSKADTYNHKIMINNDFVIYDSQKSAWKVRDLLQLV